MLTCVVLHLEVPEAGLWGEVEEEVQDAGGGEHALQPAVHEARVPQVPDYTHKYTR